VEDNTLINIVQETGPPREPIQLRTNLVQLGTQNCSKMVPKSISLVLSFSFTKIDEQGIIALYDFLPSIRNGFKRREMKRVCDEYISWTDQGTLRLEEPRFSLHDLHQYC
jgi:hypothetical protein